MPYRMIPFVNRDFYHVYNRGINKQDIFDNKRDYSYFLQSLLYYQLDNPKPKFSLFQQSNTITVDRSKKIVDVICYCIMPNHFHILLKQRVDGGISEFMRKFTHSYIKYRNIKYALQGPLFQGVFKAVRVDSDEQLLHVSRYIHLNPLVSSLVKDLNKYNWSSYQDFLNDQSSSLIAKQEILAFFSSPKEYESFVLDQADYGRSLEQLKHVALDI